MSGSFVLAFLAGVSSTLSPCVLPLLPVILGTAVSESRYGPAALAAGLALSFVTIGLFFAVAGQSIGLDQSALRIFAGVLLVLIGATLALPALNYKAAEVASPVGNWVDLESRRIFDGRVEGPVCTRTFARGCVEPVCWADAWRRVRACSARQGSRPGRRDNGVVRNRRGAAVALARTAFARSHARAGATGY